MNYRKIGIYLPLIFLFIALFPAGSWAARDYLYEQDALFDTTSSRQPGQADAVSSQPPAYKFNFLKSLINVLLILGIITGLIYFVFRFVLKKKSPFLFGGGVLKIVSTVPVAPNKYIQLVEIGNRIVMIGISENNLNFLMEISDKETIDHIKMNAGPDAPKSDYSFQDYLRNLVGKIKPSGEEYTENLDYLEKQREKLKRFRDDGDREDR